MDELFSGGGEPEKPGGDEPCEGPGGKENENSGPDPFRREQQNVVRQACQDRDECAPTHPEQEAGQYNGAHPRASCFIGLRQDPCRDQQEGNEHSQPRDAGREVNPAKEEQRVRLPIGGPDQAEVLPKGRPRGRPTGNGERRTENSSTASPSRILGSGSPRP